MLKLLRSVDFLKDWSYIWASINPGLELTMKTTRKSAVAIDISIIMLIIRNLGLITEEIANDNYFIRLIGL